MIARAVMASLLCVACAHADDNAIPADMAVGRDLRGAFRAALCSRDDMQGDVCARTLRPFTGEVPAPRPPPAIASRYRLLFVPGFLASCFPRIHSFADVVEAARAEGYAAQIVPVGGRNGMAANARIIAKAIEQLPDDGRRLVLVGHSKGVSDILEMLTTRPELAPRVEAILSIAGSLQGSPLADDLHFLYGYTFGIAPFPDCERGEGDPVAELQPEARLTWWKTAGATLRTPIYSLVTLPDLDHLSPGLLAAYALLSRYSTDNDGLLRPRDQVISGGSLLGVVNADHLSVAIPYPGSLWVFVYTSKPFARPQVVLAAIDVIAERQP